MMKKYNNILLSTKKYRVQRDYWVNYLHDLEVEQMIKARFSGNGRRSSTVKTDEIRFTFQQEVADKLIKLSRDSDVTLYVVLLSAFMVFLYRYSGREDVYLTSPVYKENPDEHLLNDFVVLRMVISEDMSFKDVLVAMKERFIKACENQDYPFDKIIEELSHITGISYDLLFNLVFASENIHDIKTAACPKNNDLLVSFIREESNITFTYFFNESLYNKGEIKGNAGYFNRIISGGVDNPSVKISQMDMLSEEEKQQILRDFNSTGVKYPKDRTITRLFLDQVDKAPETVAVVYEDKHLTYRELNRKASRLAGLLRARGVGPDSIVGIMVERSLEMVLGIMGIIKAGGAYLPIDTDTPKNRILSMLEDSRSRVLLTTGSAAAKYPFTVMQGLRYGGVEPHVNSLRSQVKNLDALPIVDRSLVDYEKYHRYIGLPMVKNSITMMATRGCPYDCTYCHKIWPKQHVVRSAENIFAEIRIYYQMGVRRFAFIDDIFNLDKKNTERLFGMIIKNNMDLQLLFPAGFRGDILTHDYIDLMVEAGTVNISMSLETASQRLQKLVKKNLDIEKLRENLDYIIEKYPQVILELFTMHGFPTETEKEAMETLQFIKEREWLHFPYIHVLKIYPGTDMEKLALKSGISADSIYRAMELAWHEVPETIPFDRSFTLRYQGEFLDDYFLKKERLLQVLPYQMKILTEEEIVQKYNSYLPVYVKSFAELLHSLGISEDELHAAGAKHCADEESIVVPGFNKKLRSHFPAKPVNQNALRILLLDLSQFFGSETDIHYDPVEPPLGLLYILTCLDKEYGPAVNGKIAKSRFDFDNYKELKQLLEAFKPDIIGARSLTFYSHFFHKTIAAIRSWGIDVPIIAGGPYTTSKYREVLQDLNIDLAVIGEGEITFAQLVGKILENSGKLPDEEILKEIPGVAFIPPGKRFAKGKGTSSAREVIMLDEFDAGPAGADIDINRSTDLAYAMFTSGSTGKPKAIMVEHANVVNLVLGLKERIYKNYEGHLKVSLLAPYVFDASVQQLFGALLQGHSLHIVPECTRVDGPGLLRYYQKNKIDISDGTPTHIRLLLESTSTSTLNLDTDHFIIGGEALPQKIVERFLDCFKTNAPKITNVYGPTECCVDSTSFEISKENVYALNNIPIGKAMPNEQVYVLDKKNRLQPIGVAGELCISGNGAARGYLNRPELTEEKFLTAKTREDTRSLHPTHPLTHSPYSPIYKTGDLARWLPDGNIEFIGRMDNQVKIKGHRIELGEIENRLLMHDNIKEAVVIPVNGNGRDAGGEENGGKDMYLCAYIISGKEFTPPEIREYLQRDLPDYMIPLNVVQLEQIPLTVNGKVNRKALPAAEFKGTAREYAAPADEVQEALVETWQQVLGMERIGIDDNFFELGGDSIKSIQISARLQERRLKLKISDIFSNPTIKQLSRYVKKTGISTHQGPVEGEVVLTPIQRYFFESNFTDRHHFNHAVMLYKKDGLDEEIIANVFTKLVEHHDALRMVYQVEEDGVAQVNRGTDGQFFHLQVIDFRSAEEIERKIEREANRIQGSIDLQQGPLVKLGLFKTRQGDHLLIAIHHLVVDGVSWRILLEDLAAGYRQVENGEKIRFPGKTVSFKYWAEELERYAGSKEVLRESDYWRIIEETAVEPLPRDFCVELPEKKLKYCDTVQLGLSEADTLTLLKDVNQAYNTEINDILLTALAMAVREWGGVEKVLINLEGHGREEIIEGANISRTIGWFTSQFPVILDMKTTGDLSYVIKSVKEALRQIPNRGIGYGILRYLTPAEKRGGLKFMLESEISFNYLGEFGQEDNHRDSIIRISPMNAGHSTSPEFEMKYALNVNGILVGRKLELSFSYNTHEYKKSSIRELVDCCKINLLRIIRHCAGKEETESTPSDLIVAGVDLSLEDLDDIKELVELNIEE